MQLNRINPSQFETLKTFIMPAHSNPNKGLKQPTLKNAFDELAFNLCQVCMQFQCCTHISPNTDNMWAFQRVRAPVHYPNIRLSYVISDECNSQFTYLRRWARDSIEAEDSIDFLQCFACSKN